MMPDEALNLPPILPVGTQVVTRVAVRGADGVPAHPRGALGEIIGAPSDVWHSYRVRFPDGLEASLKRAEITTLSHFQSADNPERLAEYDLYDHVIYRCVVGSRAYGLDDEQSDTDRRGVYLPPGNLHWSLYGVPEQLENTETEEVYWELQKFLTMALKSNPNVLECLYTPLVEHADAFAREMLAMRESFLSTMVYQTYNGYVMSQFKKLQADLRNKGQVKWKHVMHLIRLLLAGITTLREGRVPVHVGENRDKLRAIKQGLIPFEEIERWRLDLHRQFEDAAATTRLPERPDYRRANDLLIRARRAAASM